MTIQPTPFHNVRASTPSAPPPRLAGPTPPTTKKPTDDAELQKVFSQFVGQTFFSQVLGAMRKTVGKPAYLHGGRAEEIFQTQLDQLLAEKLSDASSESFAQPMYELFMLHRN
ncbi:MAG: hypothetical protein FJ276_18410 [Planctomycetes bacterium]|nr:hypothetical protein [Planctomycetota bacterium]